jgi:endogenous inhibitor of DNA gyrase (YacG/DUF329 family)
MNRDVKRLIHCPTCGKETVWSQQNPWRPFCSERCRLLDLGAWATASHRIPGEQISPESSTEEEGGIGRDKQ